MSGEVKYVSQQYIGGEVCELTGQPRSAEVGLGVLFCLDQGPCLFRRMSSMV